VVRALDPPSRPLPRASGFTWQWKPRVADARWWWCRVYHRSPNTPDGATFRRFGPLARFDHHREAAPPEVDPSGRRVLYVGADLATSACEVFGEAGIAAICPQYRVSIVEPTRPLTMFNLARAGAAMRIGALPALSTGDERRALTQQWARAVFEDQPAGPSVRGIRYRSAYNDGIALALWDCDDDVGIVRAGGVQDLPLDDRRVFGRLQVAMTDRRINVTTVSEDDCAVCRRAR
jgi:hypothetical protein